jgi:hypothetical protein
MIDALQIAADLRSAGVDRPQAEAMASSIIRAVGQAVDKALRKRDLVTRRDLAELEARLTRRIIGAVLGGVALMNSILALAVAMLVGG